MTPPGTARIHLLPAKAAPFAAVIRRKPSKCFHIIRWNTVTGALEHGSWFQGKLYPLESDVSHDGRWMVYSALGARGQTWSGLCELPWLQTVVERKAPLILGCGGFWPAADELRLGGWTSEEEPSVPLPFRLTKDQSHERLLYQRMQRDGWRRSGPSGTGHETGNPYGSIVPPPDDPGWVWRFSKSHPALRCHYMGYLEHGCTFRFGLDTFPDLLDERVEWACWDCTGALLVARAGSIARYTLADLATGTPSYAVSLEGLEPRKAAAPGAHDDEVR